MTKEEFKKLHLCRDCVYNTSDEYLKISFQYCGEGYTIKTCNIITLLTDLYQSKVNTNVKIRAVKRCEYHKEREV